MVKNLKKILLVTKEEEQDQQEETDEQGTIGEELEEKKSDTEATESDAPPSPPPAKKQRTRSQIAATNTTPLKKGQVRTYIRKHPAKRTRQQPVKTTPPKKRKRFVKTQANLDDTKDDEPDVIKKIFRNQTVDEDAKSIATHGTMTNKKIR